MRATVRHMSGITIIKADDREFKLYGQQGGYVGEGEGTSLSCSSVISGCSFDGSVGRPISSSGSSLPPKLGPTR